MSSSSRSTTSPGRASPLRRITTITCTESHLRISATRNIRQESTFVYGDDPSAKASGLDEFSASKGGLETVNTGPSWAIWLMRNTFGVLKNVFGFLRNAFGYLRKLQVWGSFTHRYITKASV